MSDPIPKNNMTNFNTVKNGAMELVRYLEPIVSIPVWTLIEPRIQEFIDMVDSEEDRNKIIEHTSELEKFVSSLTLDDVFDNPTVDQQVSFIDDINDIRREIIKKIRCNIPSSTGKAVLLSDSIKSYISNYHNSVHTVHAGLLRSIAIDWSIERLREQDLDEDETVRLLQLVTEFTIKVDRDLKKILEGSNRVQDVLDYMDSYNDRLFDAISCRDPESTEQRDLLSLPDPVIKLIVMMRWRDDSVAGLSEFKDSTGIRIHDTILTQ